MTPQATTVDVRKYLDGISFPANKQVLIQYAKNKGASNEVVSSLNSLPNREFADTEDVLDELEA